MTRVRRGLAPLAIAIGCLAVAAPAPAETVVPPENSAATQYTEAIPTGGGRQDAGKTGEDKDVSAADVIGAGKARKLNEHGSKGKAVADVVAETAPTFEPDPEPAPPADPGRDAGDAQQAPAGGGGDRSEPPSGGGDPNRTASPAEPVGDPALSEASGGSSAFGEILGQATGSSSSGQLGAFFPLLVLVTIAWSLWFAWRQRRRTE